MIVIGDAPLGRSCALACAPCSSAGPAAASAAPVCRRVRRSISLSSAVGWFTIAPSMAHRNCALRFLSIEAWLWSLVKKPDHAGVLPLRLSWGTQFDDRLVTGSSCQRPSKEARMITTIFLRTLLGVV